MRSYMAHYNLKKRWDLMQLRTDRDVTTLCGHHMTGLGTFILTKKRDDIVKEYEDIQKLLAMTRE